MSEETAPPSVRASGGNDKSPDGTVNQTNLPLASEGNAPRNGRLEPSLPVITIRSEDVESESVASRNLRQSLRPNPHQPPTFDHTNEHAVSPGPDLNGFDAYDSSVDRHHYPQSVPPKSSIPPDVPTALGQVHRHHRHHHHKNRSWPSDGHHSDPQAGVKTAPAVPLALKAKPKLYQWLFAAAAGAIIAIVIAMIHAQAIEPTARQRASGSTPTTQSLPKQLSSAAPAASPDPH